jgi:type II secretory pathway pseudopilin PulG
VTVSTRVREESGFGLVELLIAMTVMVVGITGLVAGMSSGFIAVKRAADESTAAALADTQMEAYRALPNCAIYLDSPPMSGPYAADPAFPVLPETNVVSNAPLVGTASCVALTPPPELTTAQQTLTGADGRSYGVDTYIVKTASPPTKRVTLVVRDTTNKVLVRETSTFAPPAGCKNDPTKGQPVPPGC